MIISDLHTAFLPLLSSVPQGQLFVLVDDNTELHCLPRLSDFIGETPFHTIVIPSGEKHKNLTTVQHVWSSLFAHHATRGALLVNLGGGMVSDLGGFAAATYMRGIRFVNIPTTLLAMVDASSGGKTGIDYEGIKNGVGTFTAPEATLVLPVFLHSLPTIELLSGYAEMLKHALIGSQEEWYKLIQQTDATQAELLRGLVDDGMIESSIRIKQQVVEQDPMEKGLRKVLNFGHTIGHAIESASMEGHPLPHGYCVLWGMIAETYLSVIHAGCPRSVLQQLTQVMLHWYGKPQCDCQQRDKLIQRMYHDKKNLAPKSSTAVNGESTVVNGGFHATTDVQINFTLLRDIGVPLTDQIVPIADIEEAIEYLFSI